MANQTPEHFIAFDFGGVLGSGFSHENAFEFYQNRLPGKKKLILNYSFSHFAIVLLTIQK